MRNSQETAASPSRAFSGTSAFLLLAVAFCAYLAEAHEAAILFAAIAFLSLSLTTPEHAPARPRAGARDPRFER